MNNTIVYNDRDFGRNAIGTAKLFMERSVPDGGPWGTILFAPAATTGNGAALSQTPQLMK